jgi:hypothetical protein
MIMASRKPDLPDATLRIAERMLRMPPKPHNEMKIGKAERVSTKRKKVKKPIKPPSDTA